MRTRIPLHTTRHAPTRLLATGMPPYEEVRRWLFEEALPFWRTRGIDPVYGGYIEQLTLAGRDAEVDFKRVRVACRQIYAFSHTALMGQPEALEFARFGYEYLTRRAWLGPDRGWARSLTREGAVQDPTADLYDLAFVLFALGWYHRASGDAEALHWAELTADFIDKHMRHPSGLGFLHEKPATGPRLQNPHMHLLEATLVNLENTGKDNFRGLADELVGLFCSCFFDVRTQTLAEYFTEDLEPIPGELGRWTEPGHQFEWAWILSAYQRTTGRKVADYARALVTFAEMHGVDPATGVTYNAVRNDGLPLDRASRTWPNSERIQAAVAMFELDGQDPRTVFAESAGLLLRRYLDCTPRGVWIDHFAADGAPKSSSVPSSTLYHLVIAFAEMLRVEAAVDQRFTRRLMPAAGDARPGPRPSAGR